MFQVWIKSENTFFLWMEFTVERLSDSWLRKLCLFLIVGFWGEVSIWRVLRNDSFSSYSVVCIIFHWLRWLKREAPTRLPRERSLPPSFSSLFNCSAAYLYSGCVLNATCTDQLRYARYVVFWRASWPRDSVQIPFAGVSRVCFVFVDAVNKKSFDGMLN